MRCTRMRTLVALCAGASRRICGSSGWNLVSVSTSRWNCTLQAVRSKKSHERASLSRRLMLRSWTSNGKSWSSQRSRSCTWMDRFHMTHVNPASSPPPFTQMSAGLVSYVSTASKKVTPGIRERSLKWSISANVMLM